MLRSMHGSVIDLMALCSRSYRRIIECERFINWLLSRLSQLFRSLQSRVVTMTMLRTGLALREEPAAAEEPLAQAELAAVQAKEERPLAI